MEVTYYVLLPVVLVPLIVFLILFLLRLRDPVIAARGWRFSLFLAVVGMIHFSVLDLELAITENSGMDLNCNFLLWPSVLFVPMFYYPFFFRCYYLLFKHNSQLEKGDGVVGWYTRNRLYTSFKFNVSVYLGFAVFYLILGIIIQFSTPSPEPFITTNKCLSKQIYLVIVEAVVVIVAISVVIYKLWHVTDAFYFKSELKVAFFLCVPSAAVWGLYMISKGIFPADVKSSWFVMVAILSGYASAIIHPLICTYFIAPRHHALKRSASLASSAFSLMERDRMIDCVYDPELYQLFKARCQRAWCVENLLFYKAVLDFKGQFSAWGTAERKKQAASLYENYIKLDAVLEVNLDHPVRESVYEQMEGPIEFTSALFDEPLGTVATMLRFGVFREWSLTEDFKKRFPEDFNPDSRKGSGKSEVSQSDFGTNSIELLHVEM